MSIRLFSSGDHVFHLHVALDSWEELDSETQLQRPGNHRADDVARHDVVLAFPLSRQRSDRNTTNLVTGERVVDCVPSERRNENEVPLHQHLEQARRGDARRCGNFRSGQPEQDKRCGDQRKDGDLLRSEQADELANATGDSRPNSGEPEAGSDANGTVSRCGSAKFPVRVREIQIREEALEERFHVECVG